VIHDTILCALELQKECTGNIEPSDLELHGRLIHQVRLKQPKKHPNFFFKMKKNRALKNCVTLYMKFKSDENDRKQSRRAKSFEIKVLPTTLQTFSA